MPSSTPLNILELEKKYKKNNSMMMVILLLITITLAVIAVIGFILIQRSAF